MQEKTGELYVLVQFSGNPEKVTMKIYTAAFRCIREETWKGGLSYPSCRLAIPARRLAGLANGTYYCVLEAEDAAGKKSSRKTQILVILR